MSAFVQVPTPSLAKIAGTLLPPAGVITSVVVGAFGAKGSVGGVLATTDTTTGRRSP